MIITTCHRCYFLALLIDGDHSNQLTVFKFDWTIMLRINDQMFECYRVVFPIILYEGCTLKSIHFRLLIVIIIAAWHTLG